MQSFSGYSGGNSKKRLSFFYPFSDRNVFYMLRLTMTGIYVLGCLNRMVVNPEPSRLHLHDTCRKNLNTGSFKKLQEKSALEFHRAIETICTFKNLIYHFGDNRHDVIFQFINNIWDAQRYLILQEDYNDWGKN